MRREQIVIDISRNEGGGWRGEGLGDGDGWGGVAASGLIEVLWVRVAITTCKVHVKSVMHMASTGEVSRILNKTIGRESEKWQFVLGCFLSSVLTLAL